MLLAIDVGNTSTSLGLFQKEKLKFHWYFSTEGGQSPRELENLLGIFLKSVQVDPKKIKDIAIASVVPALSQNLSELTQNIFSHKPFWVTPETAKISLRVDRPEEVGADRLCNAVAVWEKWHQPTIVVDFGTATTLDIITAKGEYGGGAIIPGIELANSSLAEACAQLNKVELKRPRHVVGRNTEECIQAGLYYGTIGMIDHLVRFSMEEEGMKMKVVATGGLANLIAKDSKTIEKIEPHLTLEGIYYIWRRNA